MTQGVAPRSVPPSASASLPAPPPGFPPRPGEPVGVAVLIAVFAGFVTWFLLPMEIKRMYEADRRISLVGPATAFWILLFAVPWYVECQSALNEYWASKGAPAAF